jgi:preprotein translocase subunit YajC
LKKSLFIPVLILLLALSLSPLALAEPSPASADALSADLPEDGEPVNGLLMLLSQLWFFIPLIAVFYFMIIRPEKRRKKEAQQLRDDLIVSDEVTTMGGIVGKVVQIKDDHITIETSTERTRVTILRGAVVSRKEKISD